MEKLNWRRMRNDFLHKSVPVPAPVFFLIFFAISWACFSLYFRMERTSRLIDSLQRRTEALESELNALSASPGEGLPEEDEADPPLSQIYEM